MEYRHLSDLERLMKLQIEYLNYMEQLIKFDSEYSQEHPNDDLPPVQNLGVLKSHFLTQRKACEGVLSITARHLPRLKAENEKRIKSRQASNSAKGNSKAVVVSTQTKVEVEKVENKPLKNMSFISLFG